MKKVLILCLVSLFLFSAHNDEPKKESELSPHNEIAYDLNGNFCISKVCQLRRYCSKVLGVESFFHSQKNEGCPRLLAANKQNTLKNVRSFESIYYRFSTPLVISECQNDFEENPNEFEREMCKFKNEIDSASKEHDLPKELIGAVIDVESDWDVFAYSKRGAQGLMQLMPITQKEVDVTNPYNPRENIHGGAKYLKKMRIMFGSIEMGLAAYNIGPGELKKIIKKRGKKVPEEAREYVQKVMYIYKNNV